MLRQFSLSLSIIALLTLPSFGWARPQLEERLTRLENIIENEFNIDLNNQIAALQQELQELRGKIEEQQNEVQLLSKKQDKLFNNLDSRLSDATKGIKKPEPELNLPEELPVVGSDDAELVVGYLFDSSVVPVKQLP